MKLSEWLALPEDELINQAPMRAKANSGYGFSDPCACQHRFLIEQGRWETTVFCAAHSPPSVASS